MTDPIKVLWDTWKKGPKSRGEGHIPYTQSPVDSGSDVMVASEVVHQLANGSFLSARICFLTAVGIIFGHMHQPLWFSIENMHGNGCISQEMYKVVDAPVPCMHDGSLTAARHHPQKWVPTQKMENFNVDALAGSKMNKKKGFVNLRKTSCKYTGHQLEDARVERKQLAEIRLKLHLNFCKKPRWQEAERASSKVRGKNS